MTARGGSRRSSCPSAGPSFFAQYELVWKKERQQKQALEEQERSARRGDRRRGRWQRVQAVVNGFACTAKELGSGRLSRARTAARRTRFAPCKTRPCSTRRTRNPRRSTWQQSAARRYQIVREPRALSLRSGRA